MIHWVVAVLAALVLAGGTAEAQKFYKVGDNNLPKALPRGEAPVSEAPRGQGGPLNPQALLASQDALLEQQIAGLAPERRGTTDVYGVLLAGHPYQQVFLREVERAGGILAARFDAGGRIARLANSTAAPDRYPMATPRNLARVLAGVARRMNPMEDVLFLYLTSHGSPGVLDTRFREMGTGNLKAREVAQALDAAGIRQAVIVVSACHSGSFLPHLKRPGWAVLAASRADRNSFGCSDANEWTWFGRALFEVGLGGTADIRRAFDEARVWVAAAERRQGFDPSEPQIQIGADAYRFLDRLADPRMR